MYYNHRSPQEARNKVRKLYALRPGKQRWTHARGMHLGPYPGMHGNRVAGLTNFRILLVLITNADRIEVGKLSTLTGWDVRDIVHVLEWGARAPRQWVERRSPRLYVLSPGMKYIWSAHDNFQYCLEQDAGVMTRA